MAGPAPGVHINDPLVRRATKTERQIAFGVFIAAINQYIDFLQQCINGWIVFGQQFIQCEAAVAPDVQALCVDVTGQLYKWGWLHEGLAATECDAGKQWICFNLGEDVISIGIMTAIKRMGIGIMTASAVMWASLGKDR